MQRATPQREKVIACLEGLRRDLEARGVSHIHLFGSVARGEANPDSDIDLLVDLDRPLGFEFFGLQAFLTDALGARAEISTRAGMRPRVRREAEKDLVRIF